jgi:amidohydrolase
MNDLTEERLLKELAAQLVELRRDLHAHPETAFAEERTSGIVADYLGKLGLAVHRGLAGTGVVGTLTRGKGPTIGLRADMDALDVPERTELPYASSVPGRMHACGHDGHTTMLLGAARYLAERGGFRGMVHFIFQPAEENLAGGRMMVEEGLFERFPMQRVFGLHNWPGLEAGHLGVRPGPVMAAADFFQLRLEGVGGHAAYPHRAHDPVVAAAAIIGAWQTLVSRSTDPLDAAVVSVTHIQGGQSGNVIPAEVELTGTVRSFRPEVQASLEQGLRRISEGIAAAHEVTAELTYERRYRPTVNHLRETELCLRAMERTVGKERVHGDLPPTMGAEDFSWMLERCPGAYAMIGNGVAGAHGRALHNPGYDFNDEIVPVGVGYWVDLVRECLPED